MQTTFRWLALLLLLGSLPRLAEAKPRFQIIDMHFHAERPDAEGPPGGHVCAPYEEWAPLDPGKPITEYLEWFTVHPTCRRVLTAPTDPVALRDRGLAMLEKYDMLALAGGDAATVEDFRSHAEARILPSIGFGQGNDFPPIDELRKLLAMLYAHPQLHVDVGIVDWAYPEKDFYAYLKRFIDAGFEQRILFGSDNMIWPDAIAVAIERIRKAPFLTPRQKKLILHDNAARFLRIEG
jgi:hypothetical protein